MKLWIWKAAYAGEARQPSMQLCRYITLIRYTSTVVRVNPEGTRDCKVIMMRKRKRMGEDTHNKMCYIWYSFSCTVTENSLTNLSRNQVRINLVHMYVCMSVCVRVCVRVNKCKKRKLNGTTSTQAHNISFQTQTHDHATVCFLK